MFVATPQHIETYSRCPRRCLNSWDYVPKISREQLIVQNVIKSVYTYQAKKQVVVPWRRISSWVEKFSVESLPSAEPDEQYRDTKGLLLRLSDWFSRYYLEDYCDPGIINLPITLQLGNRLTYADTIEIVTLGKQLRLFDFVSAPARNYSGIRIYNDMVARVRIWGFQEAAGTKPEEYVRLVVGQQTVKPVKIAILPSMVEKDRRMARQIMRGIADEAFYPSFSEQCTYCPHKGICNI